MRASNVNFGRAVTVGPLHGDRGLRPEAPRGLGGAFATVSSPRLLRGRGTHLERGFIHDTYATEGPTEPGCANERPGVVMMSARPRVPLAPRRRGRAGSRCEVAVVQPPASFIGRVVGPLLTTSTEENRDDTVQAEKSSGPLVLTGPGFRQPKGFPAISGQRTQIGLTARVADRAV